MIPEARLIIVRGLGTMDFGQGISGFFRNYWDILKAFSQDTAVGHSVFGVFTKLQLVTMSVRMTLHR